MAGLERIKATDALRKLYDQQGDMRGLAAASLYELGEAPKGISELDGKKAIGYGDPRDFNPNRSVAIQGTSPVVELPRKAKEEERVQPSATNEQ